MNPKEPRTVEEALDVIESDSRDRPTKRQVEAVAKESKKSNHRGIALALIFSILVSIVGYAFARDASRTSAAVATRQTLSESALESLREANDKLIAKGIAPIPLPPDGDPIDANALAQAAAALVLSDPRFAGLTLADLRRQVDSYFRDHPLPEGQKPTTEQVTSAVAGIYAANPPAPGRPPTAAEIAAGVSAYCSDGACKGVKGDAGEIGPTGPAGPTGEPGAPCPSTDEACKGPKGDGPTPQQIEDAVAAYCGADATRCAREGQPGPAGQNGTNGTDGSNGANGQPGTNGADAPKAIHANFEMNPPVVGSCFYVTTYLRSDGTEYDISAIVPPEMCGP